MELSPKWKMDAARTAAAWPSRTPSTRWSPDALDSIVPMAYGNLALDLILRGVHGRLVVLKNGRYDDLPIEIVTSTKKQVDVAKYYNTDSLRPIYSFDGAPLFIMTSD